MDLGGTGGHDGAPLVTVGKSVLETWADGPSTLNFFMMLYFFTVVTNIFVHFHLSRAVEEFSHDLHMLTLDRMEQFEMSGLR